VSWLLRALSTSIGQKFVMGITGLLLCGFLVAHLGGNLFLFVGEEAYNHYAEALHKQEALLKVAEVGLVALFVLHIALAIITSRTNKKARATPYAVSESKQRVQVIPGGTSSWMFATGAVVLGFLILHLVDFTWEARPDIEYSVVTDSGSQVRTPYQKARAILTNPISWPIYVIGCIALGLHLSHGFGSALQSLGLNHAHCKSMIRIASIVFAWGIGVGFVSFVVWAFGSAS
jgi:succinate dehydrogenase / fumarate reductase cytochrome b subunit